MPVQTPAAVPGQPAPPAQAGAGQAPFGTTSATGPTPNRGLEAAGLQRLGLVVKQLEEMVPLFGASSDVGKAVLDALNKLIKHVPSGSVTPASQRNQIEQMAMRNVQSNQQMQAVRQMQMRSAAQQAA